MKDNTLQEHGAKQDKVNDMIVFAHRTYHGAFPNQLDETRLSCAIGFRDRGHRIDIPWEIPEEGRWFLENLPPHLQQYTDGYTSIDMNWRDTDSGR